MQITVISAPVKHNIDSSDILCNRTRVISPTFHTTTILIILTSAYIEAELRFKDLICNANISCLYMLYVSPKPQYSLFPNPSKLVKS